MASDEDFMQGGAIVDDDQLYLWGVLFPYDSPWLNPDVETDIQLTHQELLDSTIVANVKEITGLNLSNEKILDFVTAMPEYLKLMELLPAYLRAGFNSYEAVDTVESLLHKTVRFFRIMHGAGLLRDIEDLRDRRGQ